MFVFPMIHSISAFCFLNFCFELAAFNFKIFVSALNMASKAIVECRDVTPMATLLIWRRQQINC
jgi:hypothetical protein